MGEHITVTETERSAAYNTNAVYTLNVSEGYTITGVIPTCTGGHTSSLNNNTFTIYNIKSDVTGVLKSYSLFHSLSVVQYLNHWLDLVGSSGFTALSQGLISCGSTLLHQLELNVTV